VRVWYDGDEVVAKSYLLLFRSRGDTRQPDWVSAERIDRLRRADGGFRIAARFIAVDESVLRTQNLAVFL
jgi:phthalate 3,4-dioxygenase beta subunit